MNKTKSTFYISEKAFDLLRKLSYTSRKNKSELVEEAILLLAKNPKESKNE